MTVSLSPLPCFWACVSSFKASYCFKFLLGMWTNNWALENADVPHVGIYFTLIHLVVKFATNAFKEIIFYHVCGRFEIHATVFQGVYFS